jgi:hypothetical protein
LKRLIASLGLALAVVLLPGCPVTGDIGAQCRFVQQTADGGMVPILESELPNGVDIIAFGAIECEDFVCVRNRFAPSSGGTGDALGTCSARCLPTNPDDCRVSSEVDVSQGPYTCRALLLDPESLAALCSTDPAACQIIGGNQTAYYCAQGATPPDGGT